MNWDENHVKIELHEDKELFKKETYKIKLKNANITRPRENLDFL